MSCVLLHGFTGTPAAWDDVISGLGLRSALLALPLPGHAGADANPVAAGWDANLDAIAAAIRDRRAANLPLVGYSLGARVALGLVARGLVAPTAPVVLVGVHPGLTDATARAARRAHDAAWIDRLTTDGIAAFADAWELQPILAAPRASPGARARRAAARRAHDPFSLAASLAHMGLAEMPDYLPAIRAHAPQLRLVVGADDAKFLPIARSLAATTGVTLAVVDESGHDPTLEAPVALAAVIRDALR
jgi:2-succinyl-6-hydroxy-2,4-cyclohexadiene-1-carboxylate synthase